MDRFESCSKTYANPDTWAFSRLNPHLLIAGQRGGFSGAEGMKMAADALRRLMAEVGMRRGRVPS